MVDLIGDYFLGEMLSRFPEKDAGSLNYLTALLPLLLRRKANRPWRLFIRTVLEPLRTYGLRLPRDLDRGIDRRLTQKRKNWGDYLAEIKRSRRLIL
jgi:hypothetical protein